MTIVRFPLMALAIAVLASGFCGPIASAQDDHDHGADHGHKDGHDRADMKKAEKKISEAMASLSSEDQKLAAAQRFCPIMQYTRLGSDGTPIKVTVDGKSVFVCCKGCVKGATKGGAATLKTAKKLTDATAVMAKLSMEERMAVESQKYCAVMDKNFLGTMGAPIKVDINGESVYVCCKGCVSGAKSNPEATLAKVAKMKKAGMKAGHDHGDHSGHDAHGSDDKHGDHDHGK